MLRFVLVFSFLSAITVGSQIYQTVEKTVQNSQRQDKSLPILKLLKFNNNLCNGRSVNSGICISESECQSRGGNSVGSCAFGYGVCCESRYTCGGTSTDKVSYFQNPSYPNSQTKAVMGCGYTLTINDRDCCQVRLDFETFEMSGPDSGTCSQDMDAFSVVGNGVSFNGIPSLCGNNSGQHMYVHLNTSTLPVTVQMIAAENGVAPGRWRVKASVINCYSNNRQEQIIKAPDTCTQYYTEPSGLIRSIGYSDAPDRTSPLYPVNLGYSICIERPVYARCIEYYFDEVEMNEVCTPPNDITDYLLVPHTSHYLLQLCTTDVLKPDFPVRNVADGWPYVLFVYSDGVGGPGEFGFQFNYKTYFDKFCQSPIV